MLSIQKSYLALKSVIIVIQRKIIIPRKNHKTVREISAIRSEFICIVNTIFHNLF